MPTNKTKSKKTANKTVKPAAAKKAPAKTLAKTKKATPAKTTSRKAAPAKAVKATPPSTTKKQKPEKPKGGGKGSFKKEIIQNLLDAKSKIFQEVNQKVKSESDIYKFEIGDIYDIASNERDRELSLTLGDRDREKLSEIDDALERIRDNSYGICEECGEPVAEDRLRALPFTRLCVECQSRNEKEQRIKGRFEEESGLGILEKPEGEEDEF